MKIELKDLIFLCVGIYVPTFTIMGFTIHWALIALIIFLLFPLVKKLAKKIGGFLWKKFTGTSLWNKLIQAIKNEINKENLN